MPQLPPLTLRLGHLEAPIAARTREGVRLGPTVKVTVERYLWALDRALSMVGLTEPEASLICDALNGIWMRETHSLPTIWAEVYDACRLNDLGSKHGLDEQQQAALIDRMCGWSPCQLLAVVDAVERFWRNQEATVQSVGLVPCG